MFMPTLFRTFDLERNEARTTGLPRAILGLGRSRYESTLRILGNAALLIGVLAVASPSTAQTCGAPFPIACNEVWIATTDCFNDESSYSCNAFPYPGGDHVWELGPSPGQEFWIDLIPLSAGTYDLDLFLQTGTCGPGGTCEGFSDNAGTLTKEQIPSFIADGSTYLISIDEFAGFCGQEYALQVGCPQPCSAPDILNELTCNADLLSQTTAQGTDALDYYSCGTVNGPQVESNEENIYAFTPQAEGTVTVFIDNMTTNHNLYVLDSVCDQASCIGGADNFDVATDSVSFFAVAGNTYYIVVEAYSGIGNFDLHFESDTGGCLEDCDDLIDNDGDGDTDCVDTDCISDPVCVPEPSGILMLAAGIAFLATVGRRQPFRLRSGAGY
jgi:hypothetical protein